MSHSDPTLLRAPAPDATLLVREARVLDPRTGLDGAHDVLVRDGHIAEIGAPGALAAPAGGEVVEAGGRHLFPAFTDPHVHLRTPGQEHKEDLETGTRAGAAGGYCQLISMPNTDPVIDSASILRSLRDVAQRDARIPVGFLGAITVGLRGEELTEMAALRDAGALGFTDDGHPVVGSGMLRKALQYQRLAGGILALHEEDPDLSAGGAMNEGRVSALLGIAGNPSTSESVMVARDVLLAEYEGGAIHLQHLSCAASVRAVEQAKAVGTQVTCEASPHHLCLTDEAVRGLDTSLKMNPPLRTEADRQALIAGLRSGVIDCVATDHAPHARDEKEVPFEQAPMGTTGLETAFAAIHTDLIVPGILDLALIVERMTSGCAIFGLPLPRIAPDERANLVLVDLNATWTVGQDGYESRSENCCFGGRTLRGRVLLTVADGAVAYRERGFAVSAAPEPRERPPVSTTLLERDRATLVVVDVQEAFRAVIPQFDEIARRCAILVSAAAVLGVPVIVTEQYPRGLGGTVDELAAVLGDAPRLEKTAFSSARAEGFALGAGAQVLLCGIETHVCVCQTALDLRAGGHDVHVAADAVGSRTAENRTIGLARMQAAGAIPSSTEMALFELLGAAGGEDFKTVQGLIK